jgi:hypothetical protein
VLRTWAKFNRLGSRSTYPGWYSSVHNIHDHLKVITATDPESPTYQFDVDFPVTMRQYRPNENAAQHSFRVADKRSLTLLLTVQNDKTSAPYSMRDRKGKMRLLRIESSSQPE